MRSSAAVVTSYTEQVVSDCPLYSAADKCGELFCTYSLIVFQYKGHLVSPRHYKTDKLQSNRTLTTFLQNTNVERIILRFKVYCLSTSIHIRDNDF